MSRPEDTFTSTVDGAAAFEAAYGEDWDYDDRPTLAECAADERDRPPRQPKCPVSRGEGLDRTFCRLDAGHLDGPRGVPHEPGYRVGDDPWAVALAAQGFDSPGEPPF